MTTKKCAMCSEVMPAKGGFFCQMCRAGARYDWHRIVTLPTRVRRALSAFWREATRV